MNFIKDLFVRSNSNENEKTDLGTENNMMVVETSPLLHYPSSLLTKEENMIVFSLFPLSSESLATTVVQIFVTSPPEHNDWTKLDAGVLCLVRDHLTSSYYFRVYCPERRCLVWEHQFYRNMKYKAPHKFLHSFEAKDCIVGFNFASEKEALELRKIFLNIFKKTKGKNDCSIKIEDDKKRKNKLKKKITLADIGEPTDLQHVAGFLLQNKFGPEKSQQLEQILREGGITEEEMQDEAVQQEVCHYIEESGGVNKIIELSQSSRKGKYKGSNPSQSYQSSPASHPEAPSHPSQLRNSTSGGGPPPPPPPPPAPDVGLLPPPCISRPAPAPVVPAAPDPHSNLMEAIRKGFSFKKKDERVIPQPAPVAELDTRTDWMEALRKRIKAVQGDSDEDDSKSVDWNE